MSVPRPLAPASNRARARKLGRFGGGAAPRLFLLAGVGLAWLIPALWNPTYFFALIIWDTVLLVGFLVDWFRLPSPSALEVRRSWHAALSIRVASQIEIAIQNSSQRDLRVNV